MIDPLSGNHVQFPVSNRSTAHNSERNANLPSRWPFGWSPFERGIGNFLTTLAVAMPDTNEKKSSKRIRRTMFVATIPPFLPCWFPRRVKLEIDVLKKKKRKNWRLKFHSFPAEENRWMAALIVPSRIFGYAPLRVCVCVRGVRRAHKLRPTICIVTHLPRGYVPRLFAPRLRFLRNTGGKKKRRFFLPSSLSRCPRASIRCKLYGRSFCID